MNELESYIRMSGSNRLTKFCFTDLFNRLIKFINLLKYWHGTDLLQNVNPTSKGKI